MGAETEGRLSNGLPYLRLGQGPPLFVLPGLSPEHNNPSGRWRKLSLSWCAPFAEHFTVYLVQRKPGLAAGATMSDIAGDYADAIKADIGESVRLHGTSTGGSVALQLAIDHPDLVDRMVVAAAACRLGPEGRRVQAELLRLTEQGDHGGAAAAIFETLVPKRLSYVARGAGRVAGRWMAPDDPSDMLAVLAAEDAFDAEARLSQVTAATLVQGGGADRFYSEELFRRTTQGVPGAKLILYAGKSHPYPANNKAAVATALGFLLGG